MLLVNQAILAEEASDALGAPVPAAEVSDFDLVLIIERVDLGGRYHPVLPHFVRAEVQMFAAKHSHENYVVGPVPVIPWVLFPPGLYQILA